jgi:predicted ATPase
LFFEPIRHTLRPSHDGLQYHDEVHRTAGEIALLSPESDRVKARNYFERALAVGRQQQAKSWELRAAMNMARLWHYHGKRDEALELLGLSTVGSPRASTRAI